MKLLLSSLLLLGFCAFARASSASDSGSWTEIVKNFGGEARHHPITFSANGYGYIMAGVNNQFDMWRFDPLTGKVTKFDVANGSPKPKWRTYSYGISIGDVAYLGFGLHEGNELRDWWKYDAVNNVFTQLASLPSEGVARYHPAMVSVECNRGSGKEWFIYISCGSGNGNLKDMWEYSVNSDTWTKRDSLPGPARHHPYYFDAKLSTGEHYVYVMFGHTYREFGRIVKDVYRYDPVSLTWTQMADFPGEARVAGTQFSKTYNGGIGTRYGYVLSGDGDNHGYMNTGEFWEYDPNNDTWKQLPPHPSNSIWAPGSFVIGCNAYLTSGYDRKKNKKLNNIVSYPLCKTKPLPVTPTMSPVLIPKTCSDYNKRTCKKNKNECLWKKGSCRTKSNSGGMDGGNDTNCSVHNRKKKKCRKTQQCLWVKKGRKCVSK